MDTTKPTVKNRNQTRSIGVSVAKGSLSSTSAQAGVNHFGREGEGTEVIVPSKKRKASLPLSTSGKSEKQLLGIRLLSEDDFKRAAEVVPAVLRSYELIPGHTFLVSEKGAAVLEQAFHKKNIRAERVTVTFAADLTPIIHSKEGTIWEPAATRFILKR